MPKLPEILRAIHSGAFRPKDLALIVEQIQRSLEDHLATPSPRQEKVLQHLADVALEVVVAFG